MKNFYFKSVLGCSIVLIAFSLKAQNNPDWYICFDQATSNFRVDIEEPNGSSPDGSLGSWYTWTLDTGGTITAGDDPDGSGTEDANAAVVTWTGEAGFYSITATEFNVCDETQGSQTTFALQMVKPDVIQVELPTGCASGDLVITIYGVSTDIVNYTYTDGTSPFTGDITLIDNGDGTFSADVIIPGGTYASGATIDFTINSVSSSITLQPDGVSPFSCINSTELTYTTQSFTVEEGPNISPIIVE